MLQISDLTCRIAGRTLLDRASLFIPAGHKVGLVGRNGTGKSTLLKLIAGVLQPDGGTIALPAGTRVGVVAQEAPAGEASLLDTVLAADTERAALLAELETAGDPQRIGEIHDRLADIGAHAAPARAAAILAGLGFDAAAQARPCSDFSGGWRMRVALAAMLFAEPDLLLLDEPTNHLDLEATLWLEGFLRGYPRTVLLVSHDRDLLNRVVGHIAHLEGGKLTLYAGGYDAFERTRALRLADLAARRAKQEAARARMQAFVDRFRYKASKARQAQSRLKMLARMEPIVSVAEEAAEGRLDFPAPEPLASPILALDDVSVGYGDGRAVLRNLTLRIDMDGRIALLGANGNGKSTLVKLLAGRLAPMGGTVRRAPKLRIGYFAQHQTDELDVAATPVQHLERRWPRQSETALRAHLGRFGLTLDKAVTPVANLSGGEKARLLLALMSREAPHLLLLDEPTNHLDIDAREALVEAINAFDGAVVLISHDPHLITLTADRLWLVADGTCRPYDGDLDDYRRLLLEQRRADVEERRRRSGSAAAADRRRAERRAALDRRALQRRRERAAEEAEKRLHELTARRAVIEERLADPALYQRPSPRLAELQAEFTALNQAIAAAEEAWLAAYEALD
ncbi:MAG: ABC-F family ATP-binding cassette domain-containing protein [Rhodospirillaceae bacterium]|nr:ABC-F family ATP-binding cassette domain-containing protein [Rhodospirillaceae bacterium]